MELADLGLALPLILDVSFALTSYFISVFLSKQLKHFPQELLFYET
jgi:hypothetical protein